MMVDDTGKLCIHLTQGTGSQTKALVNDGKRLCGDVLRFATSNFLYMAMIAHHNRYSASVI